ncbi:MAG: UDP-glucose 4-epimerase GalE [Candidatus Limnocylindrales bacterium]
MRVLVTGGAGYVGSVSVERLVEAGHAVIVLDSLATGHAAAVVDGARLVRGTLRDRAAVERLLLEERIEAVLHCAARSLVGQSVAEPALYYGENVAGGIALLDAMLAAGVERLVFSSTAAVYGTPSSVPIPEDAPLAPINPYGETKRTFEGAMRWYGQAYGLRGVALRYFNVAGASERNGEQHDPETHLVPNVLAAAAGERQLRVFGTDYPTPDGTCIRDYIHVEDLADAHLAALELTGGSATDGRSSGDHLDHRGRPEAGDGPDHARGGLTVCNLGSGSGFSVLEVIRASEAVVGHPIAYEVGPRRPGDPPALVASNARARELLGWSPRRGTLEAMIGSAWRWRTAHPTGYAG